MRSLATLAAIGIALLSTAAHAAERPLVMGPNAGISAGHPLTTSAAFEILARGGNAFDAGVAALLVGGVVEQDLYSLGGEALVLVYTVSEKKVISIVGQGWAPKGATLEWYEARGKNLQGKGLDPAVVPGALHAALTVLERWGTMSFEEVSARAIQYAGRGFAIRPRTVDAIKLQKDFIERWPGNKSYWMKADGAMYKPGEVIRFPGLATTLTKMVEAERPAKAQGRGAGIAAARDRFYKGDIAADMVAFLKKNQAPFELDDFAEFYARVEAPAMTTYRGYQVYKHSTGSQGPVLLEALNIFDSTPSGGWIPGAVLLGDTGIGMSIRGEQFWLDKPRAAQLRPRSRPRYTLTPSIVLRNGEPFMALGTPGGDNQDQTILQAFLNIVEFWPEWYPNLHEAFEWPRVQTLHFYGSFSPHHTCLNKLNLQSTLPHSVFKELHQPGPD